MIYTICVIVTFIALSVFHRMGTGNLILGNYSYLLGMGLPLLWNIKRKDWRNIALTLCIMAIFFRLGWLGILSIGITYAIVYMNKRTFLMAWIPLCLVFSLVIFPKVYPRVNTIEADLSGRFGYYELAIKNWKNIWTGNGYRSWSKLPENQPTFDKNGKQLKRWLHTTHSDLIQFAFEFGVIATISLLFLLFLPIGYINIDSLFNRTILASYMCILFQSLTDFPFHRAITGTFSVIIILYMYYQSFLAEEKK